MASRIDFTSVLRGQLDNMVDERGRPDYAARWLLYGLPVVAALASVVFGWRLVAPTPLLTGVALVVGSSLSMFTHLSTQRTKLTEREDDVPHEEVERRLVDELAAHLLAAVLAAVVDVALIVAAQNDLTPDVNGKTPPVDGWWAAGIYGVTSYLGVLFMIVVPGMYSAYTQLNRVPRQRDGHNRRRRLARL